MALKFQNIYRRKENMMKSYELKPTKENLIDTIVHDTIGRNKDIYHFADMLTLLNDNCVIALDGNWGGGKTFFVKQVKLFLDAHNELIEGLNKQEIIEIKKHYSSTHKDSTFEVNPQVSIYYDAWENDNDEDPIFSLIYAILQNIDCDFSSLSKADYIKSAATILEWFTGKNIKGLIDNLKSGNPLDSIRKSKNIETEIAQFLESILVEKGNRLNIFIDELDRCKPSYAVKLLERMKHYFSNDNITFIFSINLSELQHTIRKYYGNDFNASRYLDRFFDLRMTLPPADFTKFYQSINFDNSRYMYDIICDAVITTYDLSLREIAKYIRLTKIAAYDPTHNNEKYSFIFPDAKGREFCLSYVVPIMIGLKLVDTERYNNFISGKDFTPLVEIANRTKMYCIFEGLLENNESYTDEVNDLIKVSLEDKLREVYDALFINVYTGSDYKTKIGKYTFDLRTRNMLLRTISLFSDYANMNIT